MSPADASDASGAAPAPSDDHPLSKDQGRGGRLVLCPTPIGNLGDLTDRTREALLTSDLVLCEDTRRTGKLLAALTAQSGAERPPMRPLHEHNERAQVDEILARIGRGDVIALCSDAGTPLVSDPGHALVRACADAGLPIESLPGPSAALVALTLAGLPSDRWRFIGFLPRGAAAAADALVDTITTVAFEAPGRTPKTIAALAERHPELPVVVARELTKLHEEVLRGTAAEVTEQLDGRTLKGEVTIVAGPSDERPDEARAVEAVLRLEQAGARLKDAAAVVADLTGTRTNALYRAAQARRWRPHPAPSQVA